MRKFLLLLLILPCCICHAQINPQQLHFNNLTIKDGLPEGSAEALLQDKEGYIWMGTQNGLVRYDGYIPKTYILGADIPNKKSVSNLYEDKSGTLWAGTVFQGLFYYDRERDQFIHLVTSVKSDSLSSAFIQNIQEDASENLWISAVWVKKYSDFANLSKSSVVYFLLNIKTKKIRRFNITKTLGVLNKFAEDKNCSLWFGSSNGIYNYDYSQNKFIGYYTAVDSSKKQSFTNATQDPLQPGFIWMGFGNTSSNKPIGLCRFNTVDKSLAIYKHDAKDSNSISGNTIGQIQADTAHNLWVATENGLSVYNPGKNNFINYIINDEYKNAGGDAIYFFKQDKNGNFWCSTRFGLLYFNAQTKSFTRYTANEKQEDGLGGNFIYRILIDNNGILWLSANLLGPQWINKNRSRYTVYKDNPGQRHHFPSGAVNAFAEAPDGSFWLAADHGLFHWQPQTDSFTAIKLDKTQNNDVSISSVAIDKDGCVWCGIPQNKSTIQGLYSYNPANGLVKNYRNKAADTTSLPDNTISYLLSDHTGLLWIGTANKGVCYFNKQLQQFTSFGFKANDENKKRSSNKLDDGDVGSIYEDKEGNIWISTNWGGLNKYNRQTRSFISFQHSDAGLNCPQAFLKITKAGFGQALLWAA